MYPQKILFRHCDPAGIVFYPRYFEMMNDTVEAFFDQIIHFPFSAMHQTSGVPTVEIEATFTAPSRLGDDLDIALHCTKLGRTSLGLAYDARCGDAQRFAARSTVVFINDTGRSAPWPEDVKVRLMTQTQGDAA